MMLYKFTVELYLFRGYLNLVQGLQIAGLRTGATVDKRKDCAQKEVKDQTAGKELMN